MATRARRRDIWRGDGSLDFLRDPDSETFATLIMYTILGAAIGAVVWFVSFRAKA
jgi:hypothetical protein